MHKVHLTAVAVSAVACVALTASAANAAVVVAVGEPEHEGVVVGGLQPGANVEGHVGSGFNPSYNLGVGARLGYTTASGIYLGGDVDHFFAAGGAPNGDQTLLGGDVGLKIFPTNHLELRPYGFAGAAIPSGGNTSFALAPGLIGAYHFGAAYVDVNAEYMATPAPNVFLLTGGVGLGF